MPQPNTPSSSDAKPEDAPLQSPMPRDPLQDNEEPELANEADIPNEEPASSTDTK